MRFFGIWFPIWFGDDHHPKGKPEYFHHIPIHWNKEELLAQFKEFMEDNWNHPSVVLWDASNEAYWPFLGEELLPAMRKLDLSNRPWENSGNPPSGPDDPYEVHPYLFVDNLGKEPKNPFSMASLESMFDRRPVPVLEDNWWFIARSAHAGLINENDWLWLHRDGTPTVITREIYEKLNLLGPEVTAQERFEQYAYMLGGLTEFWRAYRNYTGVMYLAYIDGDFDGSFTGDNLSDVQKPELEPHFVDYMGEAFKPLGVYVNFWQSNLPPGDQRRYRIMLVNNEQETARGRLNLAWLPEDGGQEGPSAEKLYEVGPAGQMTYDIELAAPSTPGKYVLTAKAFWAGWPWTPTVARRNVEIVPLPATK